MIPRYVMPDSPWFDETTCRRIAGERHYGRRRTNRFVRSERVRTRRAYRRWITTGYLSPAAPTLGTISVQARRRSGMFAGDWCPQHLGFTSLIPAIRAVARNPLYDRWRLRWVF